VKKYEKISQKCGRGSFVRFVGVATWVSTFIRTDGRRTDGQYDRLRDGHGKVDSAIDPDQEYIY